MLNLVRCCLLLATFTALASSEHDPSSAHPTVYNDCSGSGSVPLLHSTDSTPFFKPQIRINPLEINNNGSGWEEWMFIGHNYLPDGSELVYSYKCVLGEPTSANVSHQTFIALAQFPNGTFYREIVHDAFEYEEYENGGFTYSIGNNSLTWDPAQGLWETSVNANGFITEATTEFVEPDIPFVPNYKSRAGQIAEGFFSQVDVPRGHTNGYMQFPWGLDVTLRALENLKHTWSNEVMADAISAYVRGSRCLPAIPPLPIATVTWFQTWDSEGKEVDSMQYLIQSDD